MAVSRSQQYSYPQSSKVTIRVAGREATCEVSDGLIRAIKSDCDAEYMGSYGSPSANVTLSFNGRLVTYDVSDRLAINIKNACDFEFSGNYLQSQFSLPQPPGALRPFPDFCYAQSSVPSHSYLQHIETSSQSSFTTEQARYSEGVVVGMLAGMVNSEEQLLPSHQEEFSAETGCLGDEGGYSDQSLVQNQALFNDVAPSESQEFSSETESPCDPTDIEGLLQQGYFYSADGQQSDSRWQFYCPPDNEDEEYSVESDSLSHHAEKTVSVSSGYTLFSRDFAASSSSNVNDSYFFSPQN